MKIMQELCMANKHAEDTVINPNGFYTIFAGERRSLTHYGK
jgi:hypothetical protein